ncbi:hypothetical protein FACS1894189_0350 [Planctomycetales bacterium]|nr:hypothetical protein FACS1894189_0350 [Planctomycetales bacterium]
MTPPTITVSDSGTIESNSLSPSAKIIFATVIILTGAALAAVFWRLPNFGSFDSVIDTQLTAAPLPVPGAAGAGQNVQTVAFTDLPSLPPTPAIDTGTGKYTQVYPPPIVVAEKKKNDPVANNEELTTEEEAAFVPVVTKFEPVRQVIPVVPASLEPVNRNFQEKPKTVEPAAKSDEMLTLFHFTDNLKPDGTETAKPELPENPFSVFTTTVPAAEINNQASLTPLVPITGSQLTPLLPLHENGLQPLPVVGNQ